MAATPSVRTIKLGQYRGGTRQWSNRYHFSGGTPPDSTHWSTLAQAIWTAEKAALSDESAGVEAICYAAGSDLPLYTFTLTGSGALTDPTSGKNRPIEVSALIRWSTDQRTVKNHPIYLFSYIRHGMGASSGAPDVLAAAQKTALQTYANSWVTGFSDGATTYHRAGPRGAVAQGYLVATYLTHRDFPNL